MMAVLYRAPVARSFFAQLKTGTQLPAAVTRIVTNRHRTEAEAQQSQGRKSIEWSRLFQPTQLTTFDPPWPISKRWDPSTVPRGTVFFLPVFAGRSIISRQKAPHTGAPAHAGLAPDRGGAHAGLAAVPKISAEQDPRRRAGERAIRAAGRESRCRAHGRTAGSPDRCRNELRRCHFPGRRPRSRFPG